MKAIKIFLMVCLHFKLYNILSIYDYHVARQSRGKSQHSDLVLLGYYFAIQNISTETVISYVFMFTKAHKFKINKLL